MIDAYFVDHGTPQNLQAIPEHLLSDQVMGRVAFEQMFRIKERTARGVDKDEKPFEPYSPSWAQMREKKGLPTEHVDLFFRGRMMAAMTFEVIGPGQARIFFNDQAQGAKVHGHTTGTGKNRKRDFFGVSHEDRLAMARAFEEELAAFLGGIG